MSQPAPMFAVFTPFFLADTRVHLVGRFGNKVRCRNQV
jgi:hypothetical protein